MSYLSPPSTGGSPGGGSMQLTPFRALGVAALFGGLAGWLVVVVSGALDLGPPPVPWTTPLVLLLIGASVAMVAYYTHQQLHVRRQRMPPERAVAFLVLGKASALGGAVVAGGYFTYALMFLARFDAEGPRERVIRSGISVVLGLALLLAGLRLERACRVPGSDDEDGSAPTGGENDTDGADGLDAAEHNTDR